MTDGRRPIRQISGNLQKFRAATGELRYVTVKVAICWAFVEGTPKRVAAVLMTAPRFGLDLRLLAIVPGGVMPPGVIVSVVERFPDCAQVDSQIGFVDKSVHAIFSRCSLVTVSPECSTSRPGSTRVSG
jgi:hypothetical protein